MSNSEHPDYAAAFRANLEARDILRAQSVAQELSEQSVTDLLDDIATAVKDERDEDVATLLQAVTTAYERKRRAEAREAGTIEAARTAESTSLQRIEELSDVLRYRMELQIERARVLSGVGALVTGQDESDELTSLDRESIVSAVRETRERETELTERIATVEETVDEITVPSSLRIESRGDLSMTVDTADKRTVSLNILNVGDMEAQSVSISLTLPEWVSTDQGELDVGSIDAGDELSVEFGLTAAESRTDSVKVSAVVPDGQNDTEVFRISAEGFPLGSALERADTNDDWRIDEREIKSAIAGWINDEYSTDELFKIMSRWRD